MANCKNSGYSNCMAHRYKRYRRRNNESLGGVGVLIGLGALAVVWQWVRDDSWAFVYISVVAVALLAVVGAFAFWKYRETQRKLHALDIAAVDTMDPLEFERYVAKLLKYQGFNNIRLTERYDYGIDIIAVKDGIAWGVQVKRYSNLVKAEAVRQVVTALIRYKCDRSMVVTNSTFSRPAQELAADNKCMLVDRAMLSEWIVTLQASHGTNSSV